MYSGELWEFLFITYEREREREERLSRARRSFAVRGIIYNRGRMQLQLALAIFFFRLLLFFSECGSSVLLV